MENTLVNNLRKEIKDLQGMLKVATKQKVQPYYYKVGNCIYERLYMNEDNFELTNDGFKASYTEDYLLLKLGAEKIYY